MSRSSEYAAEQDERENLSGSDMFECQLWEQTMKEVPEWAKENRRILDEFAALTNAICGKEDENV